MAVRGSCLCGKVRIEVQGALPGPNACHCGQCRKQSGHFWVSADIAKNRVTVSGEAHVTWYQASPQARRGFCGTCGSFLFWESLSGTDIAVAMGAFDSPTQTMLSGHIFVADKGDYYDISDGLPQSAQ